MNWKNDTSLTIRSSRKGCSEAIMADYKKSSVHCHSTMCDGKNTLQDMASAACAQGLTTLGFTGHSYTQRDREYCMSPSRTAQYKATIAKLEAEELKGKMHRSEDVAAMTTDLIYAIRGAMMALCKEAGVAMTAAGATFPYGIDPNDSNIRIAPSFPPVEDVEKAIAVFCTCVKMSALEKLGV